MGIPSITQVVMQIADLDYHVEGRPKLSYRE